MTNTGYVEVTVDHSLLTDQGQEVTPKDVKVGSPLLSSYPVDMISERTEEQSYLVSTQDQAAVLYFKLKSAGHHVSIDYSSDGFGLTTTNQKRSNGIQKLEILQDGNQ